MQCSHDDFHERVNSLLHFLHLCVVLQVFVLLADAQNSECHIEDTLSDSTNVLPSRIRWSCAYEHYVKEVLALVLKEVFLYELEEYHSFIKVFCVHKRDI